MSTIDAITSRKTAVVMGSSSASLIMIPDIDKHRAPPSTASGAQMPALAGTGVVTRRL